MINCNPIFKNEYVRKNITLTFSDDFETVHINNGECSIVVEGNFFQDVCNTMIQTIEQEENEDMASKMMWNTISTSLSLPYAKDEFETEQEFTE